MTLFPGVGAGPFEGTCEHMAYVPRSPMAFPGDLQHDFRDFQLENRVEIIAAWMSTAADIYLRAARLLNRRDDQIAMSFEVFDMLDARTLWASHDFMAAYWRAKWLKAALTGRHLVVEPPFKCVPIYTYRDLQDAFLTWLLHQTQHWANKDAARFRAMCLSIVGDHSPKGQADEMAFLYGLKKSYPLPLWRD